MYFVLVLEIITVIASGATFFISAPLTEEAQREPQRQRDTKRKCTYLLKQTLTAEPDSLFASKAIRKRGVSEIS